MDNMNLDLKTINSELKRLGKLRTAALAIEKRNKEFAKLTKAQKRVVVAKEVIQLIKIGTVQPTMGDYFSLASNNEYFEEPKDVNLQLLFENNASCNACALGALAVSAIVCGDRAIVKSADDTEAAAAQANPYEDSLGGQKLTSIFPKSQLALIEAAFESSSGGLYYDDSKYPNMIDDDGEPTGELKRAVMFCEENMSDESRMVKIMKNIIKNSGTFKP